MTTERNKYTMSEAALAARRKGRETMKARAIPKTTLRISVALMERIVAARATGEPLWRTVERLLEGRC